MVKLEATLASYLSTKTADQSTVDSSSQSHFGKQFSSSSLEGVANNTQPVNQSQKDMLIYRHNSSPKEGVNSCSQSTSQSYASMQNCEYISSPRELDFSCSGSLDQSQLSMQMRYAKPEVFDHTHCLRPYISEFSHDMDTSINLAQNTTLNSILNKSNTSIDFANNTIEQTNLLNFVENFLLVPLIFVPQVNRDPDSLQFALWIAWLLENRLHKRP